MLKAASHFDFIAFSNYMDGGLEQRGVGWGRRWQARQILPLNQKHTQHSEGTGGRGEHCHAPTVMKDSCVNSDLKIIMALEARENGTIS